MTCPEAPDDFSGGLGYLHVFSDAVTITFTKISSLLILVTSPG